MNVFLLMAGLTWGFAGAGCSGCGDGPSGETSAAADAATTLRPVHLNPAIFQTLQLIDAGTDVTDAPAARE